MEEELADVRGELLSLLVRVHNLEELVTGLVEDQAVIKNYLLTVAGALALPPPRFGE